MGLSYFVGAVHSKVNRHAIVCISSEVNIPGGKAHLSRFLCTCVLVLSMTAGCQNTNLIVHPGYNIIDLETWIHQTCYSLDAVRTARSVDSALRSERGFLWTNVQTSRRSACMWVAY